MQNDEFLYFRPSKLRKNNLFKEDFNIYDIKLSRSTSIPNSKGINLQIVTDKDF